MQSQSYQDFLKLSADKQYDLVQQQKQSQASPLPTLADFPEIGFMQLNSTQDKKPIKLKTYRYQAEKPKGVIIYFHTIGYHTGMSANIAKGLASNGFTFVGYDQRGHGKSEGQKGYFDDYKLIMKDAQTFIASIFKTYSNTPVFLMGHGLGSLLCIVFYKQLKEFKFSGIIMTSPSLKKPASSKVLSAVSDFALKIMPNKAGIFPLVFDTVCRNPNAAQYFKKDPNVYHQKVCVGTLVQMMEIMQKNEDKTWNKLQTCPIVIIQGQYDKVADPINSIKFFEAIKTKDKQYFWFANMWHNYFMDSEAQEVSQRLIKWLNSKI